MRKNKFQDPKRTFGLSSSMAFLLWVVMGTFLLHILECNFLTILIKPVYEKPVDTAEDIIERVLSIIGISWTMVVDMKKSPSKIIRDLAEVYVVPEVNFRLEVTLGNNHNLKTKMERTGLTMTECLKTGLLATELLSLNLECSWNLT